MGTLIGEHRHTTFLNNFLFKRSLMLLAFSSLARKEARTNVAACTRHVLTTYSYRFCRKKVCCVDTCVDLPSIQWHQLSIDVTLTMVRTGKSNEFTALFLPLPFPRYFLSHLCHRSVFWCAHLVLKWLTEVTSNDHVIHTYICCLF